MDKQFTGLPKRSGFSRFFSKGSEPLLGIIRDRLRQTGKITFAEFMELALYHPEFGYYNTSRKRIGEEGDFVTSPETHPAFGALLTHQLEQMWRLLDSPSTFTVVEIGAGNGALCRDILKYAATVYPELASALRYVIVESSPDSVAKQKALLRGSHLHPVRWHSTLEQLPEKRIVGCFLSNELIDAFPVHRVVKDHGELREVYVGLEGDEFVDLAAELSSPSLLDYFRWVGVDLPEGCQGEVNLRSIDWMREVARRLKRGFVITFDYGHPAHDLYSSQHARGTLLCYYRHTYTEDLYVRVGQQDITAHVDFTALAKAGEEEGLAALPLVTQRDYLLSLGLPAFVEALECQGLTAVEYRRNRLAMEELVKPDDLGRLKVLIQGKRAGEISSPAKPDGANLNIPLLPLQQFNEVFDT